MTSKKMSITVLGIMVALLLLLGGMTAYLDPFFHFHAPWQWQNYDLYNERYQNDGISRHFSYNAIITGTSMTENFKTSELDQLFDVHSVKLSFSGGSYKEINDFLTRAVSRNPNIEMIIRGLDTDYLLTDKDYMEYDSYPDYLYDDNIFNDVNYLFNKDIFIDDTWKALVYSRSGQPSRDFDTYANWNDSYSFGKEAIMSRYARAESTNETLSFSMEDEETVRENFAQNVTALVEDNPQIDFYLFFTPYSIVYWDSQNQAGNVQRLIEAQRVAIEMMLPYENVHLFSFFDEFDMVCNLDNYKDTIHYGEHINSQILQWMRDGEHQLTMENYEQYLLEIEEFYTQYPYEALFED